MARFRGTIQGNRGSASRLGTPSSGMKVYINGWHCGVRVIASVDSDGNDIFDITITSGSGGSGTPKDLGQFSEKDLG